MAQQKKKEEIVLFLECEGPFRRLMQSSRQKRAEDSDGEFVFVRGAEAEEDTTTEFVGETKGSVPDGNKSPPHTPPGYDEVWRKCLDLIGPETLNQPPEAAEQSDEDSGNELETISENETVLVADISGHQVGWGNSNMAQPFVMFKVDSKLIFRGRTIKKRTALHRYSDFVQLGAAVKSEYDRKHSHLVANLPSLPGKRFLVDHTSPEFIYERRLGLNDYLQKLMLLPYVQKSSAVLQFLRLDT